MADAMCKKACKQLGRTALYGPFVDAAARAGYEIERTFVNCAPRSINRIAYIRIAVRRLADRGVRAVARER
jgi:hypothetical protein